MYIFFYLGYAPILAMVEQVGKPNCTGTFQASAHDQQHSNVQRKSHDQAQRQGAFFTMRHVKGNIIQQQEEISGILLVLSIG